MHAALGERERARAAFVRVGACLESGAIDRERADQLVALRDRAAAFAELLGGRPAAALAHADAAVARAEPYRAMWWVQAEIAELELARARALTALARPDEARTALTQALPVFEDMLRTSTEALYPVWRDEARARLAQLPTAR
jgi:hypothetical protein